MVDYNITLLIPASSPHLFLNSDTYVSIRLAPDCCANCTNLYVPLCPHEHGIVPQARYLALTRNIKTLGRIMHGAADDQREPSFDPFPTMIKYLRKVHRCGVRTYSTAVF